MAAVVVVFLVIIIGFSVAAEVFISKKNKKFQQDLKKKEEGEKFKMFEIEILNKLSNRMDYSVSVQNVIEIITGSLGDFMDYCVVSYILLPPERMIYNFNVNKIVSREFVDQMKAKMAETFLTKLSADLKNVPIAEKIIGTKLSEESDEGIGSFFSIPIVVSGKVAGLLAIADARANFYSEEQKAVLQKIAQQAGQAVTSLKNAIASENSKLNAMVASMTDGVIMIDTDFKILVINSAVKKAMGFDLPAEAGNKNELSLADFAEGLKEKFDLKDKIEESIRLDKVFISEEISFPSGFYKVMVSAVKDAWKTLGSVVIFRDMTREKEVERIKEDFTSMIVHELRSPLDSIKKIAELMRTSEVKKAKRAECFQMIYGSSSDMLELIGNLLDIAKIEAGKFQLTKQPSDIKKVIESRISFFDISAKDAKVKIINNFGKNLPASIEFDPHTISQVLNNLISNAIKFTKENGTICVQALLHKNGESLATEARDAGINWFVKKDFAEVPDSLVVAVTDSGIGIAPDQIDKLFNKFVQAKSTFVEKAGTGLGLAITKSIVESHGGLVGVESVEGKGATFYFTLPIKNN